MPAAAPATISTAQVIGGCENHQAVRVQIEISGPHDLPRIACALLVKAGHARAADAGFFARIRRQTCEQFIGNICRFAPTGTLVGGWGAKPAVIWLTAQGATFRAARRPGRRRNSCCGPSHGYSAWTR